MATTNNNGVPVYAYAIIDEVADKLATMTDSELADMARRLVAQDAPRAEQLADELFDCVYMGPPLGMVIGGPAVRLDSE